MRLAASATVHFVSSTKVSNRNVCLPYATSAASFRPLPPRAASPVTRKVRRKAPIRWMLEVMCDLLAGEGWLPLEPLGELLHDSGREHVGNHEHVLVPPVVGGDGRGGILVERGDDLFDDHLEMALERDLERLPGPMGIRRGE